MVDDIAIVRSMNTDAINHEPAITFFQNGLMVAGDHASARGSVTDSAA
jgi:hypothetical protein